MSDNLDQEHLNNPINMQSESSLDEIIVSNETEIIIPNREKYETNKLLRTFNFSDNSDG